MPIVIESGELDPGEKIYVPDQWEDWTSPHGVVCTVDPKYRIGRIADASNSPLKKPYLPVIDREYRDEYRILFAGEHGKRVYEIFSYKLLQACRILMPDGKWYLSPVFKENSDCYLAVRSNGKEELFVVPAVFAYQGDEDEHKQWHHQLDNRTKEHFWKKHYRFAKIEKEVTHSSFFGTSYGREGEDWMWIESWSLWRAKKIALKKHPDLEFKADFGQGNCFRCSDRNHRRITGKFFSTTREQKHGRCCCCNLSGDKSFNLWRKYYFHPDPKKPWRSLPLDGKERIHPQWLMLWGVTE